MMNELQRGHAIRLNLGSLILGLGELGTHILLVRPLTSPEVEKIPSRKENLQVRVRKTSHESVRLKFPRHHVMTTFVGNIISLLPFTMSGLRPTEKNSHGRPKRSVQLSLMKILCQTLFAKTGQSQILDVKLRFFWFFRY